MSFAHMQALLVYPTAQRRWLVYDGRVYRKLWRGGRWALDQAVAAFQKQQITKQKAESSATSFRGTGLFCGVERLWQSFRRA